MPKRQLSGVVKTIHVTYLGTNLDSPKSYDEMVTSYPFYRRTQNFGRRKLRN